MSGLIEEHKVGTAEDPLAVAVAQLAESDRKTLEEVRRARDVLFVEDDSGMQLLFRALTEEFHCNVTYASDGEEGIRIALTKRFDLIILDEVLPGGPSGTDVFRAIRKNGVKTPVTFFTGRLDYEKAKAIQDIGFVSYIQKPMNPSKEYFGTFMEHFHIAPKK